MRRRTRKVCEPLDLVTGFGATPQDGLAVIYRHITAYTRHRLREGLLAPLAG